jgi:hypothetical protein
MQQNRVSDLHLAFQLFCDILNSENQPQRCIKEGAGIRKKPIYAGSVPTTESADMTFRYFLHNVFSGLGVHCGAAQDMDLFLNTRPLLVDLCNCKVKSSGNFYYYREEDV